MHHASDCAAKLKQAKLKARLKGVLVEQIGSKYGWALGCHYAALFLRWTCERRSLDEPAWRWLIPRWDEGFHHLDLG